MHSEILQNAGPGRLCCKCNRENRRFCVWASNKLRKYRTFAPDGQTEKGWENPEKFWQFPGEIRHKIANCMK